MKFDFEGPATTNFMEEFFPHDVECSIIDSRANLSPRFS